MESPVKKLDLGVANKENEIQDPAVATILQDDDTKHSNAKEVVKTKQPVSSNALLKAEEMDEPILRENPNRFVLFPIQYHEVCDATQPPFRRVEWTHADTDHSDTDLADVQEARGILLDRRGDRLVQGPARLEQPSDR